MEARLVALLRQECRVAETITLQFSGGCRRGKYSLHHSQIYVKLALLLGLVKLGKILIL